MSQPCSSSLDTASQVIQCVLLDLLDPAAGEHDLAFSVSKPLR